MEYGNWAFMGNKDIIWGFLRMETISTLTFTILDGMGVFYHIFTTWPRMAAGNRWGACLSPYRTYLYY
jgi:hypothetical protein